MDETTNNLLVPFDLTNLDNLTSVLIGDYYWSQNEMFFNADRRLLKSIKLKSNVAGQVTIGLFKKLESNASITLYTQSYEAVIGWNTINASDILFDYSDVEGDVYVGLKTTVSGRLLNKDTTSDLGNLFSFRPSTNKWYLAGDGGYILASMLEVDSRVSVSPLSTKIDNIEDGVWRNYFKYTLDKCPRLKSITIR